MTENKNRYYKHSRISEAKFRQILRCFAMDMTATETAEMTGISVRSINSIFLKIRARIISLCDQESPLADINEPETNSLNTDGSSEDEATLSKYIAFGIFQQGEKVYTELAPTSTRRILRNSSRRGADLDELVNSDDWKNYDGLVDVNQTRLYRINNTTGINEEVTRSVSSVDSFWSFAKRRMVQFNGIHKHTFFLHLKETEYRFNNRRDNIYREFLKVLRTNPL